MVLHLKTTQAGPFRKMFLACQDLLTDIILTFVADHEQHPGMYSCVTDNCNIAMVDIRMPAEMIRQAGTYACNHTVDIGINVPDFTRILKTFNSQESLTIDFDENRDETHFVLRSINKLGEETKRFNVVNMALDSKKISIPDHRMQCTVTMKSSEFTTQCKSFACVNMDYLTMSADGREMVLYGKGDYTDLRIPISQATVSKGESEPIFDASVMLSRPISNQYSYKFILLFLKATDLSREVVIHLRHQNLLILDYRIPSLAMLRFALAPKPCEQEEEEEEPPRMLEPRPSCCAVNMAMEEQKAEPAPVDPWTRFRKSLKFSDK